MQTLISEEQTGFRKGRSCIDNVFNLKQIMEKRKEFNLETHIVFLDYKKAFDKVSRPKLWNILQKKGNTITLNRNNKRLVWKHKNKNKSARTCKDFWRGQTRLPIINHSIQFIFGRHDKNMETTDNWRN